MGYAINEMISFFENGDVNLILLEMMSIPRRIIILFETVTSTHLPVWCGFSAKRTDMMVPLIFWHDSSMKSREIIELTSGYNFDVLGIMHSSVDIISERLCKIGSISEGPLMAYPDSGYFKPNNWQFERIISPESLICYAEEFIEQGASIIGGCCGFGPKHTKELTKLKN